MPIIRFKKSYPDFEVKKGADLMLSLLDAGLPVASSCHGDGICSKCRIQILEGADQLSVESVSEKELRNKNQVTDENRISCQTTIVGDILIDTPYW